MTATYCWDSFYQHMGNKKLKSIMADFNNYKLDLKFKYRYSKEEMSFLDLEVKLRNED